MTDKKARQMQPMDASKLSEEEIVKELELIMKMSEAVPEHEKQKWLYGKVFQLYNKVLPVSLIEMTAGYMMHGDTGISIDVKPDWLDLEKFRRGQKVAQENVFAFTYALLISLFGVFSFESGLNQIIVAGNSHTPYAAFRRILWTLSRVSNWYTSDPWTPGTPAYKDIQTVRRKHTNARNKVEAMSEEEYQEKTTISNSWCPALTMTRGDFQSSCAPPATPGQCLYLLISKYPILRKNELSQSDMAYTQFSFAGLGLLHPEFFGIRSSDEDLEAFCHMWRGIGYLLGLHDEHNFFRGTLEEIRVRSHDLMDYWVKPQLREVFSEWEHTMRCLLEGLGNLSSVFTYNTCLLDFGDVMGLNMPQFYESTPFMQRIRHVLIKFYFQYLSRLSMVRSAANSYLIRSMVRAQNFDEKKHKELQEQSVKTVESFTNESRRNRIKSQDYMGKGIIISNILSVVKWFTKRIFSLIH